MDANEKLRFALRNILSVQEGEANCDECFDHLDKFVEMVEAGQDAAKLLPRIEHHLESCRCCFGEYEALLTMLRAEMASSGDA